MSTTDPPPLYTAYVYFCAVCDKELVEVTQAELAERFEQMARAGKIAAHDRACLAHAHYRCATPSCAALMPPGWFLCMRPSHPEIEA
jgi:hypothetical protein